MLGPAGWVVVVGAAECGVEVDVDVAPGAVGLELAFVSDAQADVTNAKIVTSAASRWLLGEMRLRSDMKISSVGDT